MFRTPRTVLVILTAASFAIGTATAFDLPADGEQIFLGKKCGACHSVSTAGIKAGVTSGESAGGDLARAGYKRDAGWLKTYLRGEAKVEGAAHAKTFKGTDEELQALVDWLLEQKAQ